MDVDVVDTSDIDEREVLDVAEADNWIFYSPQSAFHHDASNPRGPPLHNLDLTPCRPSPRKRTKVFLLTKSLDSINII